MVAIRNDCPYGDRGGSFGVIGDVLRDGVKLTGVS